MLQYTRESKGYFLPSFISLSIWLARTTIWPRTAYSALTNYIWRPLQKEHIWIHLGKSDRLHYASSKSRNKGTCSHDSKDSREIMVSYSTTRTIVIQDLWLSRPSSFLSPRWNQRIHRWILRDPPLHELFSLVYIFLTRRDSIPHRPPFKRLRANQKRDTCKGGETQSLLPTNKE